MKHLGPYQINEYIFGPKAPAHESNKIMYALERLERKWKNVNKPSRGPGTHIKEGKNAVEIRVPIDPDAAIWQTATLRYTISGWTVSINADDYNKTKTKALGDVKSALKWINSLKKPEDMWK